MHTDYEYLDWSDIVRSEIKRGWRHRLREGTAAFGDFIVSGTAARYFKANWRYAVFFLGPFVNVVLFAAIGAGVGVALAAWLASTTAGVSGDLLSALIGVLVALCVFTLLLRWPGQRWRLRQGFADWVFAREYMLGRRPDIEARVEAFADRVIACARRAEVDEIVVCGHSFGAILVIDVLARAYARDPDLGRRGPRLCLLTIGATIPKLALHPAGEWLRAKARRLAEEPSLSWAEYQARDDIISFHKFDPVRLRRIDDANPSASPIIRRVQIHQMLTKDSFARFNNSSPVALQLHAAALPVRDGERTAHGLRLLYADVRAGPLPRHDPAAKWAGGPLWPGRFAALTGDPDGVCSAVNHLAVVAALTIGAHKAMS